MVPSCWPVILLSFHLISTIRSYRHAEEVERELIEKFEQQGDVYSRTEVVKEIGEFKEPLLMHMNHTVMTDYLHALADKFPNLTHLYSIGNSVRGRQLWVLTISKYPRKHETGIPEFKYIANMHGNEVSGRVFLLGLAWTLLYNYHTNGWIQKLVDTTRIHLLPTMNPDGYEIAYEGDDAGIYGRSNANNKDLNRNFPSRFPNYFPSEQLQPETMAVMKWTKSIPFILSASLHGGTTLVNYPFDDHPTRSASRRYSPSPDNELFVRLAYSYSKVHDRMNKQVIFHSKISPLCLFIELLVYIVSGGMQDWNYLHTNCFELTIELNCVKYPPKSELKVLWDENKYPLLYFIKQIHNAIHGRVVDAETGQGLLNVTVSIDDQMKIVTTYSNGEFWRPVNIGQYQVSH
ncbi:Carboxypeptidase N catalytic chain [Trichostrongylus colubriformis]|uniref:Carboxypeptidase N catalytic chain n=1 Tax=Trichostrongylus colubriformis TaxID=6319 RepID=A0AAN8IS60_TRICO